MLSSPPKRPPVSRADAAVSRAAVRDTVTGPAVTTTSNSVTLTGKKGGSITFSTSKGNFQITVQTQKGIVGRG